MFLQLNDFLGVDTGGTTPSVLVPTGDYNLIVHDMGRSALPTNKPGVTLLDLTDDLKRGVGFAQQSLTKLVGNIDAARVTELLYAANHMNLGGQKRLIAITAKKSGNFNVKIAGKELDILARKALTVKLAMIYYRYTGSEYQDKWTALGGGLDSKTHSKAAVEGANKYYRPQANISFDLQSAKDWATDGWIDSTRRGPAAEIPNIDIKGGQRVAKTLVEKKLIDSSADISVIVVPRLYDTDAVHLDPTADYPNVIYTPWIFKGRRATDPKADLFVPELCHELIHGLGKKGHSSRAKVMCNDHSNSTLDQELLIDKDTLDQINPASG